MKQIVYLRPSSMEEALKLLDKWGERAKIWLAAQTC